MLKNPSFNIKLIYVTGYWKTDHNVTQGKVHFIIPANSHTHALPNLAGLLFQMAFY